MEVDLYKFPRGECAPGTVKYRVRFKIWPAIKGVLFGLATYNLKYNYDYYSDTYGMTMATSNEYGTVEFEVWGASVSNTKAGCVLYCPKDYFLDFERSSTGSKNVQFIYDIFERSSTGSKNVQFIYDIHDSIISYPAPYGNAIVKAEKPSEGKAFLVVRCWYYDWKYYGRPLSFKYQCKEYSQLNTQDFIKNPYYYIVVDDWIWQEMERKRVQKKPRITIRSQILVDGKLSNWSEWTALT